MDDVFGDGMFVRYCKCICGVGIVYDNTVMALVYCDTTRSGMWRGQKFHENGYGQVCDGDGGALGGVFGDEVFVRYCECIGGAVTVCDNAAMQ